MFCDKCGTMIPEGGNACPYCGNVIEAAPVAPVVQAEPVAPVAPAAPVAPVAPAAPVTPVAPVAPVAPTAAPSPKSVLILGILSLALGYPIVGMILGIIGMKKAKAFEAASTEPSTQAKVGKILSLIGMIFGIVEIVAVVIYIIAIVVIGVAAYNY